MNNTAYTRGEYVTVVGIGECRVLRVITSSKEPTSYRLLVTDGEKRHQEIDLTEVQIKNKVAA